MPTAEDQMTAAAYKAAAQSMRMIWSKDGAIDPRTQIGKLSDRELDWLASMAISQWITERCRQWSDSRKDVQTLESFVQEFKPGVDVERKGDLLAALPTLGKWCAERELAQKAITEWSRDDVTAFIELAWEIVGLVKVSREETPDVPSEAEELMMAG